MRSIAVLVGLLIGFGALAARFADSALPPTQPQAAIATDAASRPAPAPSSGYRTVVVRPDGRGHFRVDGRVDGRRMEFMVDTGASVIALRASSAAEIGVHPAARDFTAQVSTANGTIRAARTSLGMVEIGGLTVRDVQALVIPDEALGENLLGLSFLRRLRRFEYADGRLVLEQ